MLRPRDIAPAISRLRGGSLLLFDRLTDQQLELTALPGWTVADVFRHLADSDRGAVLGFHLREFLPGRDLDAFEEHNDANLQRLRGVDRATLRRELQVWGQRLSRAVALVPGFAARLHVPTAFGRVPLGWVGSLRLYDEWVHQWDVQQALGEGAPPMDLPLRELLAEFQLRALPARSLESVDADGVVEVRVVTGDGTRPEATAGAVDELVWRFDLERRRFGAHVRRPPTATVRLDTATFCLVAADRVPWREAAGAGAITLEDDDARTGAQLLDHVRVV